jgi:FkbM family methyltransferase
MDFDASCRKVVNVLNFKKPLTDIQRYGFSAFFVYLSKFVSGMRYEYHRHFYDTQNQGLVEINCDGFSMADGLTRGLEFNGVVDPLETKFIVDNLKNEGDRQHRICLDVGANNGYYSCLLASLAREVFAFEPMQSFSRQLNNNIKINGFDEIVSHQQYAVSDEEGTVNMADGLVVFDDLDSKSTICDLVTLDKWCKDRGLLHEISFIKIDVEGAEGKVVAGAQEVIAASKPIILAEIAPHMMKMFGDEPGDIFVALEEAGYEAYQSPFPILGTRRLNFKKLGPINSINYSLGINFLFVHKEANDLVFSDVFLEKGYIHYQPFLASRRFIEKISRYLWLGRKES